MSKFRLSRRAVLRGAGAVLALPLLEAMLDGKSAYAQSAIPQRYLLTYGGHSLGGDDTTAKLLGESIPLQTGATFTLPYSMLALAAVQAELAIISSLRIPTTADPGSGGVLPPGGKPVNADAEIVKGSKKTGTAAASRKKEESGGWFDWF